MNKLYSIALLLIVSTFTFSQSVMAANTSNNFSDTYSSSNTLTNNPSTPSGQAQHYKQLKPIIYTPNMNNIVIVCSGGVCYPVIVPH